MRGITRWSLLAAMVASLAALAPATASASTPASRPAAAQAPGSPAAGCAHEVRSGETARSIASLYGMTLSRLQSLNPGVNLNNLHVGQLLNVDC